MNILGGGNIHCIYPMTKIQFMQKREDAEMPDFCMAALVFLVGHVIKARTHACVKIAYFPTWCIIRTWRVLGLWPHAPEVLMMTLIEKFRMGMGSCHILEVGG